MTFSVDHKVRQCATVTKDNTLLGKLSTGDMIALEAKYHTSCLLTLYYKAGSMQTDISDTDSSLTTDFLQTESLALAEVIAYMEDANVSESTPTVFKLSELARLYATYLPKQEQQCHQSES